MVSSPNMALFKLQITNISCIQYETFTAPMTGIDNSARRCNLSGIASSRRESARLYIYFKAILSCMQGKIKTAKYSWQG
jgi:hypothetical protein